MANKCIALIDSGVGGLSVLSRLCEVLPEEDFVYFADDANLPYGNKTAGELEEIADKAVKTVLERFDAGLFVLACNTLTAAAIDGLRKRFADKIFVGCEPNLTEPVKRGMKNVLVLCTTFTKNSERIKERFVSDAVFLDMPYLADMIESMASDEKIVAYVRERAGEAAEKADCVTLGCTHYFLKEKLISDALNLPVFSSVDGAVRRVTALNAEKSGEHLFQPRTLAFFSSSNRVDVEKIRYYMKKN